VPGTGVASVNQNAGTAFSATAACTGGKVLVGGGAEVTGNSGGAYAVISNSSPSTAGSQTNGSWSATATWVSKANVTLTLTAYALCAG
jgi:hypothetical protein